MPWTGPLTTDDLDEIGFSFSDQPFEVAAELVDAVDRGLVADRADTGHALMLAAELINRAGDLRAAQVLAERAASMVIRTAIRKFFMPNYCCGLVVRTRGWPT